ncbi:DUF4091 domain-containing protein [Ructibacterium gallinarum]|uniref:DUF4091 domain-containing protein n=1 Tax=Ructibacterium gallinarum TaxID=2779355 RepID=A0A9D5M2U1_9FIRM|nr:DUF4091 domain-containing protein [Ructibacterium gallinarum]MBE5039590.1 DUF4091 domain-containing protein [Ructibacterium gallinarum]
MEIKQLSSLEKIFICQELSANEIKEGSALRGEVFSYQVAYHDENALSENLYLTVKVETDFPGKIKLYTVGNVPSEFPANPTQMDDNYITTKPGIYPDVLFPYQGEELRCHDTWQSVWISAEVPKEAPAKEYDIKILFYKEQKVYGSCSFKLQIIAAELPEQELIFTQWFYADCIADYYQTEVFSERHWELIESFAKLGAENGINTILTPVFTPPLDTAEGGERTAVQLVDISLIGTEYQFDFTKLERWIEVFRRCGYRYFEIAHLFSQWGAKYAPQILVFSDGETKKMFGWHTQAESEKYQDFLKQFLPALIRFFAERGLEKRLFFHLSDEPSKTALPQYLKLKQMLDPFLKGFRIIDACSDMAYYKDNVISCPIPAIDRIQPFLEEKVPDLWCYYCCEQGEKVSNRFIAMPSARNRIIGVQLYKYDIRGFLHWGYNFYNSALSKKHINPFLITDADGVFPSGDAFSVYPGEEGALPSIRLKVFYEAIQDMRALQLLERLAGRPAVLSLIEENGEIRFDQYPKEANYLLSLRERVNQMIAQYIV